MRKLILIILICLSQTVFGQIKGKVKGDTIEYDSAVVMTKEYYTKVFQYQEARKDLDSLIRIENMLLKKENKVLLKLSQQPKDKPKKSWFSKSNVIAFAGGVLIMAIISK